MVEYMLADVATIASGAGFPIAHQGTQEAKFPFLKVSDMNLDGNERVIKSWNHSVSDEVRTKLRAKAFPAGSLIFPKIGAAIATNKKRQLSCPSCVDNNVMAVIPKADYLDGNFLYYLFLNKNISDFASDSNPPSIRKSEVESWKVLIPSVTVQRRIVDVLSRAEGIVRLHQEAERKTAELIPALFVDMFGDPASNSKNLTMRQFGEVGNLDRGRSRHRPRDAEHLYGGPYPFIQTGDVSNSGGRITKFTSTYSAAGLAQSKLWSKGTLCITIAANIAKTGVLEFDACFPDSVVGFIPFDVVKISYVQAWLGFLQPTLEANAPQAAQKNINLEILRNLPIPLPDIQHQVDFESRCQDILSIKKLQAEATAKAQATFNSLLAQVFSS
jgi:type I restriction enzyme S subunit